MKKLVTIINKETIKNTVDTVKVFSKIEIYLRENNIELTDELLDELLCTPKFSQMCDILLSTYSNNILDEGVEEVFLSNLIRRSLIMYQEKNNIVLKRKQIKEYKCGLESLNSGVASFPILTDDEILILIKEAQNGNIDARNKIIVGNLRFIMYSIKKFCENKNLYLNVSQYEDMFDESIFGLIKAINMFDLSKDTKFSTYAHYWIIHYITRLYKDNRDIVYYSQRIKNLYSPFIRYVDDFWVKHDKKPETDDIKKDLNVSEETAIVLQKMIIPKEQIDASASDKTLSEDDFTEELANKFLEQDISNLIKTLNDSKKEYILSEYYGFSGKSKSLREIGDELKVSGSYVGYLKNKALEELRQIEDINELAIYLGDKKLDAKKENL